ncbi:ribonuclease III [Stratiformator vulcanicus]|uniref:Ribonuclease 3 n=1 Tax=Stratiformator vulcanicus TaxID=2527980 RepID=A0A517QYN7_9PLAN|nr:ribonuclease III [Stratiformator vulcanicus]QDT36752.1 Ribonuclease 3 [Stratiformator vulcanicus]
MSQASGFDVSLTECERILKHTFGDRKLLMHCLTHSSIAATRSDSNERLEFLGDSVLGLIVCELLFREQPDATEGDLTRLKSTLVSRVTCARMTSQLGLDRFVLLGKGLSGADAIPDSVLGAAFEALIAGLYLDGGFDAARRFLEPVIRDEMARLLSLEVSENYKSRLQHYTQARLGLTPSYRLLGESGPDHSKRFQVVAVVGEETFEPAWGGNKKEAEQAAARNALGQLDPEDAHESCA